MFSCEFCKIFKNTFFTEHLRTTAFVHYIISRNPQVLTIFTDCLRKIKDWFAVWMQVWIYFRFSVLKSLIYKNISPYEARIWGVSETATGRVL